MGLPIKLLRFFEQLEAHNILLIEWENTLLNRLGYPHIIESDLFFLVPDEQLPVAAKLAASSGYDAADRETLPPRYPCEYANCGIRYIIHDPGEIQSNSNPLIRLVLLPLSWTGISCHESIRLSASENKLPCTVCTVPVSAACTAFVRILARENQRSKLRMEIIGHLCSVIAYHYFDTSYEGDYLELPPDDQPWSEKEVREMENAVRALRGWEMKEGEEWIRSELIRAMTGVISYDDLPFKKD